MSTHDYEVFLSFRGPDTRSGFADFLYTSLVEAGIGVYRDDEELHVGEEIGPELLQAIKQSKILIPIFSKGYGSSKWCLRELVQMMECKKEMGHKIVPIFYDVEPIEVRHQTNDFGKAFDALTQNSQFEDKTIEEWKSALKQVGILKGWELASVPNRREGKFAKEITRSILTELKKNYLEISDYLVEVDSKVEEIMRLIGNHSGETKIIGIHGLGGIGKTTLAKIVYNRLSCNFQHCCFLANIREASNQKGIEQLQNQLISNVLGAKWLDINNVDEGIKMIKARLSSKKVLLLLDDVDKKSQLNALLGNRNWYGKGSNVIITSRNKEILNVREVDWSYELTCMDFYHSLQLFSKHAFRRDYPLEEYIAESTKAVKISGGLPLALEVIGSLLYGKHKKFWDVTLNKLEKIPHEDVRKKLMISFEMLDDQQKNIFLDVACFFIGFDRSIVTYMWDSCDFFPEEAIEVLVQMSLIKIIEYNRLWMHDQLRDLGREIVRQQSKAKLEEQSRIWDPIQAFDVLRNGKGTRNIEAICLKFDHQSQYFFSSEEFASLPNLRFLHIESKYFDETNWYKFIMKSLIVSKLKWLSWHNIPSVSTLANLTLVELVILDLSRSKITENWNGWNNIKIAKNLKVLNLMRCIQLERTPDLSNHAKLEQLILEGCESLTQIDKSIGQLTNLVLLNVNYCCKLCKLPDELGKLEVLTELLIKGTSIRDIPEWTGMKKLEIFNAHGCQWLGRPNSIGCFTSLTRLSLVATRFLQLPNSIGQLVSLIELDLSYSSIIELPHSMGKMKNLRLLRLTGSSLERLPNSIGMLEKLEEIDGKGCHKLKGEIPSDIVKLSFLRILKLTRTKIDCVPKLPDSLNSLWFETWSLKALKDCSNLLNLRDLDLGFYLNDGYELSEDQSPWWIGSLHKLESLCLASHHFTTFPKKFVHLSQLKRLVLCCSNLRCLPQLPQNLSYLCIIYCTELSPSIDLSNLVALEELVVENCRKIKEIQFHECLENLRILNLRGVTSLEKLPNLTNLKQLRELEVWDCPNVIELTGTSESLERIDLQCCYSLEKLSDPSNFKKLKHLYMYECERLNDYLKSSDDWRNWTQNNEHFFECVLISSQKRKYTEEQVLEQPHTEEEGHRSKTGRASS